MIPILTVTVGSPSVKVFEKSVYTYNPLELLVIKEGGQGNFGDDFNWHMAEMFFKYDEIIIANDDIVLNPDSYRLLVEDVKRCKGLFKDKLGFVAARSNEVRPCQNIRNNLPETSFPVEGISPLFAYISKKAFETAQFPPINWFSDDVMCEDLNQKGFRHFVSRSYVHHVGSSTIGKDNKKNFDDAIGWVSENRPDYWKRWIK